MSSFTNICCDEIEMQIYSKGEEIINIIYSECIDTH